MAGGGGGNYYGGIGIGRAGQGALLRVLGNFIGLG